MAYTGTPFQTLASGLRTGGGLTSNFPTYREQIFDRIAYVQGIETPNLNVLQREDVWNTLYSFVMGQIRFDRTSIPADVEGKQHTELGDQSGNARLRAWNGIHIHSKDIAVSDVQRNMREVGVPDEYQHQAWEQMLALAVEFENILLWSRYQAGSESTYSPTGDAPQTHGLYAWAYDTGTTGATVSIAGQDIPDFYSATHYQGTGANMTRTQFNENLLQPAWEKGMEIDKSLCFVGTKVKNVMSQYAMIYNGSGATLTATPLNERGIPASAMRLVDKLDIYEGDWGRVFVIKNRNMANSTPFSGFGTGVAPNKAILAYEPRYMGIAVFEGFNHVPLAKLGSTSQGYCEAILGTICRNPRAMFSGDNLAA